MHRTLRTATALLLVAALALTAAFASSHLGVDASAVPFAELDADADLVGVSLAVIDGDLVVVFVPEGTGTLGEALVPFASSDDYATNAVGDVDVARALVRSELIVAQPGGFSLVLDGANDTAVADRVASQLRQLGFDVDHRAGGRIVDFAHDGTAYRATFVGVDGGVRAYFGEL